MNKMKIISTVVLLAVVVGLIIFITPSRSLIRLLSNEPITLVGIVEDNKGQPVDGVTCSLIEDGNVLTQVVTKNGNYDFGLRILKSDYSLVFEKPNYKTQEVIVCNGITGEQKEEVVLNDYSDDEQLKAEAKRYEVDYPTYLRLESGGRKEGGDTGPDATIDFKTINPDNPITAKIYRSYDLVHWISWDYISKYEATSDRDITFSFHK